MEAQLLGITEGVIEPWIETTGFDLAFSGLRSLEVRSAEGGMREEGDIRDDIRLR